MRDLLRAHPEHPFHPYIAALEHADQARAFATDTRARLLNEHRGQVLALEWDMSSAAGEEHFVANITLVLAGRRRLGFGNTTVLDRLDGDDWEGVDLDGDDLVDRIAAREDVGGLTWRQATLEVLADVLGIPPGKIEGFCWLVEQLVYDLAADGAGQYSLTVPSQPC
jgi:hypothetical protein